MANKATLCMRKSPSTPLAMSLKVITLPDLQVAELAKLDVSRNEIVSIPEDIFGFTSLTSLDVR